MYPLALFSSFFLSDFNYLGDIEFKRCACESEFYKYVVNNGSDVEISNKVIKKRTYFFGINPSFEIWTDFENECKKCNKENILVLKDLIKDKRLTQNELNYIYKFYDLL